MKEQFRNKKFSKKIKISYIKESEDGNRYKYIFEENQYYIIKKILEITQEYEEQDITLTVRQLYYQLVSRGIIPNAIEIYKRMSSLINDMKYAGLIDWDSITDRARPKEVPYEEEKIYNSAVSIINWYRRKRWDNQHFYLEIFSEKDALYSVVEPIASKYHITFSINRGYASSSVIYELSKRIIKKQKEGKQVIILYIGDHDPSGLDMIRDMKDRLTEFIEQGEEQYDSDFIFKPIILNQEQIKKFNPPPNPAKFSDPRADEYVKEYGKISWEADALDPLVIRNILEVNIQKFLDIDKYNQKIEHEKLEKEELKEILDNSNLVNFSDELRHIEFDWYE